VDVVSRVNPIPTGTVIGCLQNVWTAPELHADASDHIGRNPSCDESHRANCAAFSGLSRWKAETNGLIAVRRENIRREAHSPPLYSTLSLHRLYDSVRGSVMLLLIRLWASRDSEFGTTASRDRFLGLSVEQLRGVRFAIQFMGKPTR